MESTQSLKMKLENLTHKQLVEYSIKLSVELSNIRLLFWSKGRQKTYDYSNMTNMFDEIESVLMEPTKDLLESEAEAVANSNDDPKPPKKPKTRSRRSLPIEFPRERVEVDLAEKDKVCPLHFAPLVRIGSKSVEKLEIIPMQALVKEIHTFAYKCPCCQEGGIVESKREADILPKSFATPSLLAHIITGKFVDGMPLHRQERIYDRLGIELSRSTMARWVIKLYDKIKPVLNLMREDLLSSLVLYVDETEVQVLDEPNKSPQSKSYMWVAARKGKKPIVSFHYHPHRNTKAALSILDDYQGIVVADGYKVYESLARSLDFTLSACLAHIRRKFWEAEKFARKEVKEKKPILASVALALIKKIYAIEREIADDPPDRRLLVRQSKSKPIMEAFKSWLDEQSIKVLPSSPTGKAISYALSQWNKMLVFLDHPEVDVDNNYVEGSLRPFVLGRNAWLFSQSIQGAEASAAFYSLIETAKKNLVDPYSYLELLFKELPRCEELEDFEKLLPYNISEHFQIKKYLLAK